MQLINIVIAKEYGWRQACGSSAYDCGNPSVYASLRRDLGLINVQHKVLTYNKDKEPDTPGSSRSLSLPQDDNGV